jgi:hypothetical protein
VNQELEQFKGKIFCLDTSSIILARNKLYPPEIFESLWEDLQRPIKDGRIVSVKPVYKELEQKEDDQAFAWAKENKSIFKPESPEAIIEVKRLMDLYEGLVSKGATKEQADPWGIAHARLDKCVVVAQELQKSATNARIKIQGVCAKEKLPHINVSYMIQCLAYEYGWKYTR